MASASTQSPRLGVIEGFYGRPWSESGRLAMIEWLAALGFDAYLYAPKADAWLRRDWRRSWPTAAQAPLRELAAVCERSRLDLYVGLSPYAVYECYDAPARARLRERVLQISDLGAAGVALLFDDMPGSAVDLAGRQAEICDDVQTWCNGAPLLMCPTYYSDDPVLDRVFGKRPEGYADDLGARLATDVTPFWTGPAVCSTHIDATHLADVCGHFQRPVALWDNYPVNDSRARSEHLYLQPLADRSAHAAAHLHSHWCNAMNQPALSLPALTSLIALYRGVPAALAQIYAEAGLTEALRRACEPLAGCTLAQLDPDARAELQRVASGEGRAANELRDWLAGAWQFDPACLTD